MQRWLMSVCLSVPHPKSRMEGRSKWTIAGGKSMTWVTMTQLELERSRSPGRLMLRQKMCHIFGMGRPMNFKLVIRMEHDDDDPHSQHVQ